MYDEIVYWNSRSNPNVAGASDEEKDYLHAFIHGCESVLDYGVGAGRMLPVYAGKMVAGYDIVPRYEGAATAVADHIGLDYRHSYIAAIADVVVCTSVLMHVRPEKIEEVMCEMAECGDKVVVITWSDTSVLFDDKTTDHHCYNHNYKDILLDYEVIDMRRSGTQLYFVYAS